MVKIVQLLFVLWCGVVTSAQDYGTRTSINSSVTVIPTTQHPTKKPVKDGDLKLGLVIGCVVAAVVIVAGLVAVLCCRRAIRRRQVPRAAEPGGSYGLGEAVSQDCFLGISREPRFSRRVCLGPSNIGVDRRRADEKPSVSYACVNIGVDRRRGDEELLTLGKVYKVESRNRGVVLGIGSGLRPRIQVGSSKGGIRKSVLKRPGLVKKVVSIDGGVIEIDDMTLKIGPGCLTEDTEITLINRDTDIAMKSLLDLGLLDAAPRVVEFLPDGLKFQEPADLMIRFEKTVSDSELFIFHGSYNNNWQKTTWELVTNGIKENIVGGVVNVKINSFCLFSYIFAKRGKLARILSHLNHSFTCRAYVFYRRLFSMDTIDISVVLLSEFVDEKEEEDIKQLNDHFEAGYVKGEKGMLKRVHTNRSLEMCVDFPGVESAPFSFVIDRSQLDSVGFVVDHVKGVPVKSPASGTVKISSYTTILWKLIIYEMKQEIKVEEANVLSSSPDPQTRVQSTPPEHAPEVAYRTTKLTNGEISQISRKVGIDWDSLAGLMDIPYSEREEIRVNFGNYLSLSSKAKRVFELFNDSKCFGRHIMVKYFEELRRHDLKNEMLPMKDEDEGEDVETPALQPEISEVPLRDNTPLSSREMYRLSQRIVVDWDRLAGLMDITRAERDDIRYSLLYNNSRSRAEKILSIFNQRENFSRKELAGFLAEIQQLELVKPVATGEWRRL